MSALVFAARARAKGSKSRAQWMPSRGGSLVPVTDKSSRLDELVSCARHIPANEATTRRTRHFFCIWIDSSPGLGFERTLGRCERSGSPDNGADYVTVFRGWSIAIGSGLQVLSPASQSN